MSELMIVGMLSVATVAIAGVIVVLGSRFEPRQPAGLELRAHRDGTPDN